MSFNKYSIILPVKNGGYQFKLCVKSILSQTYHNFELLILDNNSKDGSLEWISNQKDQRIKVYASPTDLSIEENWGRITNIPKSEFMTIIGHDDLLDHNYLSVINKLIEKHPTAALYQTHFRLIDKNGDIIRRCYPIPEVESSADFLSARFRYKRDSFGTGYVMRSKAYDSIGGIPKYKNLLYADDALWLLLLENSWKATASEECFSYRLHYSSLSGKPDPEAHLISLSKYVNFLKQLEVENDDIKCVIKKYALNYFREIVKFIMIWALYDANENNVVLDVKYKIELKNMMRKVMSTKNVKISYGIKISILTLVNKLPFKKNFQKALASGYKITKT